MRFCLFLGVSAAVVAAACSPAPSQPAAPAMDPAAMRAGIMQTLDKVDSAIIHKDAAALAANYAPDATWLLPDGSIFHGRDSIQAGATAFFKSFDTITPQPVQIDAFFPVDSTDAVIFAQVPYTVTMKGKKPEQHINYFATHFVKSADGTWLAHHDFNVDATVKASGGMSH
jgi:uncharacterized protein (TIGR02246 family)